MKEFFNETNCENKDKISQVKNLKNLSLRRRRKRENFTTCAYLRST
jgi:hypothetical protein